MTFLFITDSEKLGNDVTENSKSYGKSVKIYNSDFSQNNIKKQYKHFEHTSICIIFSAEKKDFTTDEVSYLSSLCGYLIANNIPVYTNLSFLKNAGFLLSDSVIVLSGMNEIQTDIQNKYEKISTEDLKRVSQKKLLDKGIPFTPDCFALYITKNKPEIFNLFISAGIDVNARDETGTPMLNIAVRNDNLSFAKKIIELGADINAVSEDRGYTAVMDAVWRGNIELTKLLISKKADLNTISKEGQNNLVLAVGADRDKIVKLLAENGADPDVKDMMGMSAYGYATLFKKEAIVEILKPYHKA